MPPQIFRPSYNYNMECTSSLSSSSKIDDFPLSLVLYFQCRPYCSYQRELIDDLGNRLLQSNSGASLLYHQTRVCERLSYNESKIVYICRFVPQILFFFCFFCQKTGNFYQTFGNSDFNLLKRWPALHNSFFHSFYIRQTQAPRFGYRQLGQMPFRINNSDFNIKSKQTKFEKLQKQIF